MLGSGAMTNSIDDIVEHADVIMLVGSNPEEAHPVIGMRIRQAVERGCRLIVGGETKFACVDGPEFDGDLIDFDLAMKRSRFMRDKEAEAVEHDHQCNLYGKGDMPQPSQSEGGAH